MSGVTIVLLRGINVGGKTSLPMADLRAVAEELGAGEVRTYIQSGNLACTGQITSTALSDALETKRGIRPHVLTLSLPEYETILKANPFTAEGDRDGKAVHVWFLDGAPTPLTDETLALATETEAVEVAGRAAYLLAPDGIGRSKLAAKLEKALGTPATARNWNSAIAIRDMARELMP